MIINLYLQSNKYKKKQSKHPKLKKFINLYNKQEIIYNNYKYFNILLFFIYLFK